MSYLALILGWALPVIALEWAVGWRTLTAEWRPLVVSIAMATLYLGCADIAAIRDQIWDVNPLKTIGFAGGGFVPEEWLVIFVTNTMIAQAAMLALDDGFRKRATRFLSRR